MMFEPYAVSQPWMAAIFGLLIGSFLNVCIYRLPRDLSVVRPRSFCPECGKPVAWFDNVPVASFLLLGGKARCCGHAIGRRYLAVEALTAALFVAVTLKFGWTAEGLKWCVFETILMVLFWTDLEERILPDEFTIGGAVAGLVLAAFTRVPSVLGALALLNASARWQSLAAAVLGIVILVTPIWLVAIAYSRLRQRQGMGPGDLKLLAFLGAFLGPEQGIKALLIGTVGGLLVGLGYIVGRRKDAASYELPLGSFLCAGAALVPFFLNQSRGPLDVP